MLSFCSSNSYHREQIIAKSHLKLKVILDRMMQVLGWRWTYIYCIHNSNWALKTSRSQHSQKCKDPCQHCFVLWPWPLTFWHKIGGHPGLAMEHFCQIGWSISLRGIMRINIQTGDSQNKYVHLRGLMYIHTCRSYVHTPCELKSMTWSHQLEHSTSFTRWPIRPILGFWGSKVPQIVSFPALDASEPPCKIWCR